jgi:hypothetical protein
MDKLKRYVGLLAAILVLVVGFIPVGQSRYHDMAAKLTPLDGTVLSAATAGQDLQLFWLRASDTLVGCPPFAQTKPPSMYGYVPAERDCNSIIDIVYWLPDEYKAEMVRIEPALPEWIANYDSLRAQQSKRAAAEKANGTSRSTAKDPALDEIEVKVGAVAAKYLDSKRQGLATERYLLHFGWVVLALLMAFGRQLVGGLLLLPFSLILGAAGASAKAARGLHDRV